MAIGPGSGMTIAGLFNAPLILAGDDMPSAAEALLRALHAGDCLRHRFGDARAPVILPARHHERHVLSTRERQNSAWHEIAQLS